MKNIFNFFKKHKLYLLTFLISLLVIIILFILNNVIPFGKNSLLAVDFFHQYGPMLGELHDRIKSGNNLIYSFNVGLGIPFFRNFLNYMSSPFNLIMIFFSKEGVLTSFSFIIGLKAVFSSCTLVYFLSHKFKTKSLLLIPLGVLYAFSAYYTAYYWNIMWLDGMVFLPLITLGIEYIINEHKWKFYTIWLAIMLIANYFIGYMICIYSVIYFIAYCIKKANFKRSKIKTELKQILKKGLIFAGASLLAGMIASIFLIPLYQSLESISATGGTFPTSQYYKFTIEDFLKYHLTGTSSTVFASDPINAPNISAGILSVFLLLCFIFNSKITLKTKICYASILLFIIVAFFYAPLDYIMQAFHVPNDLPYRYSFLYTFTLIIMGAYAFKHMKNISFKKLTTLYAITMLLLIICCFSKWVGISLEMIIGNMILLTSYFVIISFIYFKKKLIKALTLIFIIVTCVDATISVNDNWDITQVRDSFYYDYDNIERSLDYIKSFNKNKFYRIEKTSILTFNDPAWYNYYGMETFSSMAYENMAKLQYQLGMPGNQINSYYYVQQTPIYDLMFDINYIIGYSKDKKRYIELNDFGEPINLFMYSTGIGFGVNNNLKNWDISYAFNPFRIQNAFIERATNVKNILIPCEPLKIKTINLNDGTKLKKYTYKNENENMYFYTNSYLINYFIVNNNKYYLNDNYDDYNDISDDIIINGIESYGEKRIINISPSSDTIDLYINFDGDQFNDDENFYMYTINEDNFKEAYNILIKHKLIITDFKENYIKATINLDDDMFVYTSINYDDGWEVYVDNQKTKTFKLGDALLAFDVPSGDHVITLKYFPKGFKLGFALSISGILILIAFTILEKHKKKQK